MRKYTAAEFAEALASGRKTATGMVYATFVAGKGTAGVVLYKEPHHTSKDTQAAKRDLQGKFRLVEIETKVATGHQLKR